MLTLEELAAMREKVERATAGPWDSYDGSPRVSEGWPKVELLICKCYHDKAEDDARFIAAARTDVPRLLTEVERLQQENERLTALVEKMKGVLTNEGQLNCPSEIGMSDSNQLGGICTLPDFPDCCRTCWQAALDTANV